MQDHEFTVLVPAVDFYDVEGNERKLFDTTIISPKYSIDGAYPSYVVQDLVTEGVYGIIGDDFNLGGYRFSVLLEDGDHLTGPDSYETLDEVFGAMAKKWDEIFSS